MPDWGLVFWTTLSFALLFYLLSTKAWKPILSVVNEREQKIEKQLAAAEAAKREMELLTADNERILREARQKKDQLLKEARDIRESIIDESKEEAKAQAEKIILQAREAIKNEKMAAITDLKNQVGELSIDIAQKILKSELDSKNAHIKLVDELLNDVNIQ